MLILSTCTAVLLLLALRLNGPLRYAALLAATPLMLALVGRTLHVELGLSTATALCLAVLCILALIGLPALAIALVNRKARAAERDREARRAAIRDLLGR